MMVNISIIIPIKNEVKNIPILHKELLKVLNKTKKSFEILYIDDGSTDGSYEALKKLKKAIVIKFKKNFGQTPAMSAGIKHSKGNIIITMDGDLQNDPRDIPNLLKKMNEGYDLVSGWRYKRKDTFFKKAFSKIANKFRRMLINDKIHDSGCSLKAYKRECFDEIKLYGEMHRYIPALLGWKGFKIGEVKVNHFARKYGETKYGFKRLIKGFIDLLNIWFWRKYSSRPLHIFGGIGIALSLTGFILTFIAFYQKIFLNSDLSDNYLSILSVLLIIMGVQFFVSGILADISIKKYYENHSTYTIERITKK